MSPLYVITNTKNMKTKWLKIFEKWKDFVVKFIPLSVFYSACFRQSEELYTKHFCGCNPNYIVY